MQNETLTSGKYIRVLTFIHAAMLGGQVFFALIAYFLVSSGYINTGNDSLREIFKLIVPIFTLVSVMLSHFLFRNQISNANTKAGLYDKLMNYRTAVIVKLAFLEGPAIFSIVGYLLTTNGYFLIPGGLVILIFLVNKPSRNSLVYDLNLKGNEKTTVENSDAKIV